MEANYQNIRQLYLEKITGLLEPEEEQNLLEFLKTDQNARTHWESLEAENEAVGLSKVINSIDVNSELEAFKNNELIHFVKPRLNWQYWFAAASIILMISLLGAYLNVDNVSKIKPAPISSLVNIKNEEIMLSVAGGKQVKLSTTNPQQIVVGTIKLSNTSKKLIFTGNKQITAAFNELTVPAKKYYEIILADGTKVSMNSVTKLRFPFMFSGFYREIYLEGEAYFEVAKDATHPFVVHTGNVDIVVKGTHFNVNTYNTKSTETSLLEGSVELKASGKKTATLTPGLQAHYSDETGFSFRSFESDEITSWRRGAFYFSHTSLGELKELFLRWYGVILVFDRKSIASHQVSGTLERGKLDDFLANLRLSTGFNARLEGNILHLTD
jgi:transmembrane sensor